MIVRSVEQMASRKLTQQIAVFGESGSGKTVLLSSFYGAAQEPEFSKENLFHVVADDVGQGHHLLRNYLGMRDSAATPGMNRFKADTYSFSIKLKDQPLGNQQRAQPFDALQIVWHDYPGEWFEQEASSPTEAQRRVETFRSLLGSDIALLLVDAQRLLDNKGEEERYLKLLMGNLHNTLLSLKDELLEDGEQLVEFPRIWMLGLSKVDLVPEMDVFAFRDLMISKVGPELGVLRETLEGFVQGDDALAVGEDFVLLSSAKFQPGQILVKERIGVDLMLPLAAVFPFERHLRWKASMDLPGKVAENLVGGAELLATALVGIKPFAKKLPRPLGALFKFVNPSVIAEAANLAGDKLHELNAEARRKNDNLTAAVTKFKLDLEEAQEQKILLESVQ